MENQLLSTIPVSVLIVLGALIFAAIGSYAGFVFSGKRKQFFLKATLILCLLLLAVGAGSLALALR